MIILVQHWVFNRFKSFVLSFGVEKKTKKTWVFQSCRIRRCKFGSKVFENFHEFTTENSQNFIYWSILINLTSLLIKKFELSLIMKYHYYLFTGVAHGPERGTDFNLGAHWRPRRPLGRRKSTNNRQWELQSECQINTC